MSSELAELYFDDLLYEAQEHASFAWMLARAAEKHERGCYQRYNNNLKEDASLLLKRRDEAIAESVDPASFWEQVASERAVQRARRHEEYLADLSRPLNAGPCIPYHRSDHVNRANIDAYWVGVADASAPKEKVLATDGQSESTVHEPL